MLALVLASSLTAGPEAVPELARHRGRIVVLNYWASWCLPCRAELPLLSRVQREYEGRGVQVLGASIDEPEDRTAAKRLAKRLGVSFPVRYDATTAEMARLGLATAVPATAIFDRDGRRVFRIIGEAKEVDVRPRLDWLLGDRADPAPDALVLPPGMTPGHFAEHEAGEEHEDEHERDADSAKEAGSTVPT